MEDCKHTKYIKHGRDRNGNQRYRCLICKATWVDKRRDNRVDKSIFVYTKDMLIDWLDGHSYKTLARNYRLSPYYSHFLINSVIKVLPDYREMINNHEDLNLIEWVGIDGGYIVTNRGKIGYLIAIDLDTNTFVHYKRITGETAEEIVSLILEIKGKCPNLKGITTDQAPAYKSAVTILKESYCVDITHSICRVHIFMSFRGITFKVPLAISHRKYKISKEFADFEVMFRQVVFNTKDEESFEYYYRTLVNYMDSLPDKLPPNFYKAVKHLEKQTKQHLIKQIPYKYTTNNLTESWWNLLKTKFKTTRSLGANNIDFWFNLFILRYHFNHLNYDGTFVDSGKRFKISKISCFEDVLFLIEQDFRDIMKQHNFKRSLIFYKYFSYSI